MDAVSTAAEPTARTRRRRPKFVDFKGIGFGGGTLRLRLVGLVAVAMVPMLVLGAAVLWTQYRSDRARAEQQLVEQARTLARLVDGEFNHALTLARMLAASETLARNNNDAFERELRAAREELSAAAPSGTPPAILVFVQRDGTYVLNTAWRPGERHTGIHGTSLGKTAIATGHWQISDLMVGPTTHIPLVGVAAPVFPPSTDVAGRGNAIGSIGIGIPRERFIAIVSTAGLPPGALASIQDRNGVTVARSVRDVETLGRLPTPVVLKAIMSADAGTAPPGTLTLEKVPSTIAFAHAPESRYIVKIDVPEHVFLAPLRASLLKGAITGTLLIGFGLALALVLANQIVSTFRKVPLAVAEAGTAGGHAPNSLGIREADELAATLATAREARDRAANEARALFDNSPIGMVVSDTGGRVYAANDTFLKLVARSREDLEHGRIRWDEITPEEWIAQDEAAITEAVARGRCNPFEKEYLRPDGSRVPVLISFGLTDRSTGTAAAFVVDMTERRQNEAALRDSEARFRAITDTMPQIVWSTRPDGHHDYFNQRWYDLTGTRPEQTEGQGWIPVFHPDDQMAAWQRWRHSLATGEPYEIEYRLRMADDSYRWMLGRALPIRNEATGAITRWFGTCTDIEETVAARQALARSREELEALVRERTRALEETQARLVQAQRMEALGQLAGGIAHDINNVLQAVQGSGSLIAGRPDDADTVRRLIPMILTAAERGANITRRLLAFTRQSELRAERLQPGAVLAGMREILGHTLGDGIEVRVDAPIGLPSLLADKAQFETVLVNLATNARDAMGGIGTLTLHATGVVIGSEQMLDPTLRLAPGTYVAVSVGDDGAGMDAATLARASEPFFTTKPPGQGTGLGLAMARGFAEQSGGALQIWSESGAGTTVTVWLPVAETAAEAAQAAHPVEREDGLGRDGWRASILLVDDDAAVRDVLAESLEADGLTVCTAASGEEAFRVLESDKPVDVLVSDFSMPGMNGLMVIREAQRRRQGLPAILLTGYADGLAEMAARDADGGTFTLLHKPISARALSSQVSKLFD